MQPLWDTVWQVSWALTVTQHFHSPREISAHVHQKTPSRMFIRNTIQSDKRLIAGARQAEGGVPLPRNVIQQHRRTPSRPPHNDMLYAMRTNKPVTQEPWTNLRSVLLSERSQRGGDTCARCQAGCRTGRRRSGPQSQNGGCLGKGRASPGRGGRNRLVGRKCSVLSWRFLWSVYVCKNKPLCHLRFVTVQQINHATVFQKAFKMRGL